MARAKTVYVIKFLRFFPFEYPRRRHVENEIQITDASSVRLMMIILAGPSRSAVKDKKGKGGNIFSSLHTLITKRRSQTLMESYVLITAVCLVNYNFPFFYFQEICSCFYFLAFNLILKPPAQFLAQTYSLYFDRAFSFC